MGQATSRVLTNENAIPSEPRGTGVDEVTIPGGAARPTDAVILTVDVLLAPMEAREQLRADAYGDAFRVGAAAVLLELPPRVVRSELL